MRLPILEFPPENYSDPYGWWIGQYYAAMTEMIRRRYDDAADADPELAERKRACMIMHLREGDGVGADTPAMAAPNAPCFGPNRCVVIRGELMPVWATYLPRKREIADIVAEIPDTSKP